MGQAEPTPTDEPVVVHTTPTDEGVTGKRANHTRLKNLAAVSAIAAVTFAALLIAFSVRLGQVSGDRDDTAERLAAAEVELAATSDELEVVSSALDDATTQLDDALGQVADVSSSLEATTADAGELGQLVDELTAERDAYEADLDDSRGDVARLTVELADAEDELAFYSAPASPEAGPVVVEGRWEVTWNESSFDCGTFDDVALCRKVFRLSSFTSTTARAAAVTLEGSALDRDATSFAMRGEERTSYACNNNPVVTLNELSFNVTSGDLVGGTIVARSITGTLKVSIGLFDECTAIISGTFTAVRTD